MEVQALPFNTFRKTRTPGLPGSLLTVIDWSGWFKMSADSGLRGVDDMVDHEEFLVMINASIL
jgi:hypothetical protein